MKLRLSNVPKVTQLTDGVECKLNGSNETPRAPAFNQYTNPNSQRILTSVVSVALGPQRLEWQNSAFPTYPLYSHGLSSVCVHKARELSLSLPQFL